MSKSTKSPPADKLPEGVTPFRKYEIMAMDQKELKSLMSETLGSLNITEFDLEKIVVPTGGGLAWEITNAEGEVETPKGFEAVILNFKHVRAHYEMPYEETGGGSQPDCSSNDGEVGVGTPGGNCTLCPLAQFGSSRKPGGRGQDCNQNMILFIIRPDEIMPSILKIPPTSIKAVTKAICKIAFQKRVHYYHGLVRFCLKTAQNAAGVKYSEVAIQFLGKITSKDEKTISTELHTGLTPLVEGKSVGQAFLPTGQAAPALSEPAERRLLDDEPQGKPETSSETHEPPMEPDELPDAPAAEEAPQEPDEPVGDFL